MPAISPPSVQADNGIVFDSLMEGESATHLIGTTCPAAAPARSPSPPTAPSPSAAETVTHQSSMAISSALTGPLVSLGADGIALGNAVRLKQISPSTIPVRTGHAHPANGEPELFYGNIIIGNANQADRAGDERCGARLHHAARRPSLAKSLTQWRHLSGRRFVQFVERIFSVTRQEHLTTPTGSRYLVAARPVPIADRNVTFANSATGNGSCHLRFAAVRQARLNSHHQQRQWHGNLRHLHQRHRQKQHRASDPESGERQRWRTGRSRYSRAWRPR